MTEIKIGSPEITDIPVVNFFRPSELMGAVDAVFASERAYSHEQGTAPALLGAIACKVVPDCNFRCAGEGYACYEYQDDSWERQPPVMPDEVITQLGTAIADYTAAHDLDSMDVILHGGEPLFTHKVMKPADYYDHLIGLLGDTVSEINPNLKLRYAMQTNASLITQEVTQMLERHNISVNCSIDGDEVAHNRNRRTKGRAHPTFKLVDRGIRRLAAECPEQLGGLLAVIDLRNSPIETYEALCSYNTKVIDFLLPYEANWDTPPYKPEGNTSPTPYADWLLTIFHRWWDDRQAGKDVPDIRLFRSILNLSRGGQSLTEAIGPDTSRIAFVRADGSIEGLDAFKASAQGENNTGIHISETNSLDKVSDHLKSSHQLGRKILSPTCQQCTLKDMCGGGHLENRYSTANGFNAPSVFCEDLKLLIKEVVGTANATYRDEKATASFRAFRDADGKIPLHRYPLYQPFTSPPPFSLATHIRFADAGDAKKITDVHGEAYFAEYQELIDPDLLAQFIEEDLLPAKYSYWRKKAAQNSVVVATLRNQIVGFAALEETPRDQRLVLQAHYELPETKGYGIGDELLQEVEHLSTNPQDIFLRATVGSKQAQYFEQRGYEPSPQSVTSPNLLGVPLGQMAMIRRASSHGARVIAALRRAGM